MTKNIKNKMKKIQKYITRIIYLFLDTLGQGRRLDSLAGAETKEMTERPLKTEKRWVKFVAMSTRLNCWNIEIFT